MQEKQQSASWRKQILLSSEYIANVTGHRGINFLNDYDEAKWNNENLSAEKMPVLINTGSFQHRSNCGFTHPSMAASKENKLPPSFSGFKSQKFVHESSYDGVSGTDNDEQSLNSSASVFHLWRLEAFSWFQNSSILLVNASCKHRALIIEDEVKNTYFYWLL